MKIRLIHCLVSLALVIGVSSVWFYPLTVSAQQNMRDSSGATCRAHTRYYLVGNDDPEQRYRDCVRTAAIISEAEQRGATPDEVSLARENLEYAINGSPFGMWHLANMLRHGIGQTKNLAEAARWYRTSARRGHESSMIALAIMLENGQGVTKNLVEARRWRLAYRGGAMPEGTRRSLAQQVGSERPASAPAAAALTINRGSVTEQPSNSSLKVTRYVSDNNVVETIETNIAGRASFFWDRSFFTGDISVLAAESDNNVTLGIEVFDTAGKEVCRGTHSSEGASCVFTPTYTGPFRVKVTNHSGNAAQVAISDSKSSNR